MFNVELGWVDRNCNKLCRAVETGFRNTFGKNIFLANTLLATDRRSVSAKIFKFLIETLLHVFVYCCEVVIVVIKTAKPWSGLNYISSDYWIHLQAVHVQLNA